MIEVRRHPEQAREDWDQFVRRTPETRCYHLWGWRHVLGTSLGHKPIYLSARQEGQLNGILPLILVRPPLGNGALISLPFVTYGGVAANNDACVRELVNEASRIAIALGADRLELRHEKRQVPSLTLRSHRVCMMRPLPESSQLLWKGLRGKLRNQVRKADKMGVEVRSGGLEMLDAFYDVFAQNMHNLGSPVWSKSFFARVLKQFPDRARLYHAHFGTLPIAAGLTLRFKQTVEIPWASSLRDYNHLCANVRMYWQILADAADDGYARFDFGRSAQGGSHYTFKRRWGAEETPLLWQYWPEVGAAAPALEEQRARLEEIWRRLPSAVSRWVGPPIRRYLPQ